MPIEATIDEAVVETPEAAPDEYDVGEEASEETPEEAPAEPTVEDLAKDMGWRPKDEFQGNDDTYVDPATYIRRSKDIQQSMSQHLKDNRRKMDGMEQGIKDLHDHYQQVSKVQIAKQQKEIEKLREAKREAIEEGDVEKVDEIESEMLDKYNSMEEPPQQKPKPDQAHVEAFDGWKAKNDWYSVKGQGGDTDMTAYADKMANLPEYDNLPYDRKLTAVTELVKKAFPEKFQTQATPTSNAVEAPSGTGSKRQFSMADLSSDQRGIVRNFVKRGIMSEKEYIKQLAEAGEIG